MQAITSGNLIVWGVFLLGFAGAAVLLLGQRFRSNLLRGVGFSTAAAAFLFVFAISLHDNAPPWLVRANLRLLGRSAATQALAGAELLRDGAMNDAEFRAYLDADRGPLGSSDSPVQRVRRLVENDQLPAKYYPVLADWMPANRPKWALGPNVDDPLLPAAASALDPADPRRSALIDFAIADIATRTSRAPQTWNQFLPLEMLRGRLTDRQASTLLLATTHARGAQASPTPALPGQLIKLEFPLVAMRDDFSLPIPAVKTDVSLQGGAVLRNPVPPDGLFARAASDNGSGWAVAPLAPGDTDLTTQWNAVLSGDEALQHFDLNIAYWPKGLRPEDFRDYAAVATFKTIVQVQEGSAPPAPTVSDEDTRQIVERYLTFSPRNFDTMFRPPPDDGAVRAMIHVRGPAILSVSLSKAPVDLAFDVSIEINGVRTPAGFLFAPKGHSDSLRTKVVHDDWVHVTPYLILTPNTAAAARTPGATGVYDGPEIRRELDVMYEYEER